MRSEVGWTDRVPRVTVSRPAQMQTAAEYRASAKQAYRLAELQLDVALRDPAWTAATEQTGDVSSLPPAVILDLDETVLDNSAFQARGVRDTSTYSEAAWNRWAEERKAGAIPGAIEFLTHAKSRGVAPFYVTNRSQGRGRRNRIRQRASFEIVPRRGLSRGAVLRRSRRCAPYTRRRPRRSCARSIPPG